MESTDTIEYDFDDDKWPFTGEGKFQDVLQPKGVGCTEINKLLVRADEHAGEYSFGGLAEALPAVPGLLVDGVGPILTPLYTEQADKLIALCKKSPFGHNLDTKMDENVRKSWQLEANLVKFTNPQWQVGIDKLRKVIADRLGYRGIPLECVLYKLLVYGEGGHFVKHQDTEKEDGMIATLVVQPPSAHEGGDLVVYREGELAYRHDFGKSDGSAAYAPHYAVHYADAEHALEQVTKGFRLVLVYSICLPPTMRHLERPTEYQLLSDELTKAISRMGLPSDNNEEEKEENDEGEDENGKSFALLLSHEYTTKSIVDLGSGALKGIDRARFQALEAANALVAPDKKLRFFIAQLAHDVRSYDCGDDGCEKQGHVQSITWYSTSGEDLGQVRNFRGCLNLLNPGKATLSELWGDHGFIKKEGGYTGNEGSTRITTYLRYALVAWRVVDHTAKALKWMPVDAAVDAVREQKPVDAAALRVLFNGATARLNADNRVKEYWEEGVELSMKFREVVCELLVDVDDPSVVNLFFDEYCGALGGSEGNEALVPLITAVLRTYDWDQVGKAALKLFYDSNEVGGLSAMNMLLRVANGLDSGAAQQALHGLAARKMAKINDKRLFLSSYIGLLWKAAIVSSNKTLFDALAGRLKAADPSLVGPSIQYLSQYVSSNDSKDEKAVVVASITPKRVQWLKTEIEELEKPFSWEMRDAQFPDSKQIQAFLRGADKSMETKGVKKFKYFQAAIDYAAKWQNAVQVKCSFEMEAQDGDEGPFVTITKTRDWFTKKKGKLVQYRKELRRLVDGYDGSNGDGGEKKRSRQE